MPGRRACQAEEAYWKYFAWFGSSRAWFEQHEQRAEDLTEQVRLGCRKMFELLLHVHVVPTQKLDDVNFGATQVSNAPDVSGNQADAWNYG